MKKLQDILWFDIPNEFKELVVSDICDDSRKVTKECVFVAISGSIHDGNKYINDAINAGAKYVILKDENVKPKTILKKTEPYLYMSKTQGSLLRKLLPHFFRAILKCYLCNGNKRKKLYRRYRAANLGS